MIACSASPHGNLEGILAMVDPKGAKPSPFRWALYGYLLSLIVSVPACWVVAVRSNDFDNQTSFRIVVGLGALAASEGYWFAVRRRKKLGVSEPSDEWQHFVGSWTFYALAGIVLAGSLLISVAESLIYDLVYGAPWLNRP